MKNFNLNLSSLAVIAIFSTLLVTNSNCTYDCLESSISNLSSADTAKIISTNEMNTIAKNDTYEEVMHRQPKTRSPR